MRMGVLGLAMTIGAAAMAQPLEAPQSGHPDFLNSVKRGKGRRNRRGNGVQAKPRKRPNMKTVSKRVRRKHRRAE